MPVVINEFEVVSESPQPPPAGSPEAPAGDAPKQKLEPAQLQAPLCSLHQDALRVWAH